MPRLMDRLHPPKVSPGTVKAVVFILLVVIALAFWLYIQKIFDHVREFQKSVVQTHVKVYSRIIDPASTYDSELIDLFEPVVMRAPYPSIFTDKDLNPIQGLWHNVGVPPGDDSEEARDRLKRIVAKMDRVNPPVTIFMPGLKPHTDTLTVYEIPHDPRAPVLVTDQLSNYLYSRNIDLDLTEPDNVQQVIKSLDVYSNPVRFERENEPTLVFHSTHGRKKWPIVILEDAGTPLYWKDIVISLDDTTSAGEPRFRESIDFLARNGIVYDIVTNNVPVKSEWLFHYGDLPFLTLIGWLPVIELGVILVLISIAFIGLMNIKNAEQRSIWVGMAKETAHQLGTPISSLNGWIELLKSERSPEMLDQALPDMEYDVKRLSRVAARFSSVGSRPELKPIQLSDVIDEVLDYYRARLPQMGKTVVIEGDYGGVRRVMGNGELLNWAFENLVKNSLSAVEAEEGRIRVSGSMSKDFKSVILDFTDNGRGIPPSDQGKVMRPGFTTKKRGWGLGLSLVKRIIEDYHGGKVILLESRVGVGTTFRVILPALTE